MFIQNFLCFSYCLLALVLLLGTTGKSLAASFLHLPSRDLYILIRSLPRLSLCQAKGSQLYGIVLEIISPTLRAKDWVDIFSAKSRIASLQPTIYTHNNQQILWLAYRSPHLMSLSACTLFLSRGKEGLRCILACMTWKALAETHQMEKVSI